LIRLRRIISGGQTGVDRGALRAAAHLGFDRGGFAPLGWKAEDGKIPAWYRDGMTEMKSADYSVRTRANVEGSGGTLILCRTLPLRGGTQVTRWLCGHHQRPCLVATLPLDAYAIERWLSAHHINTLNVAGPRESKESGIEFEAYQALVFALRRVSPGVADEFGA
jgi:hypothetical protein